jgi:hypothetical protein
VRLVMVVNCHSKNPSLVPLEFGSVNLTGEVLAGACRVDEESLHERVWLKVELPGRAEVRRIMFEICLSN